MNSKNNKASNSHRLLINVTDKINFELINLLLYQILSCTIHEKI